MAVFNTLDTLRTKLWSYNRTFKTKSLGPSKELELQTVSCLNELDEELSSLEVNDLKQVKLIVDTSAEITALESTLTDMMYSYRYHYSRIYIDNHHLSNVSERLLKKIYKKIDPKNHKRLAISKIKEEVARLKELNVSELAKKNKCMSEKNILDSQYTEVFKQFTKSQSKEKRAELVVISSKMTALAKDINDCVLGIKNNKDKIEMLKINRIGLTRYDTPEYIHFPDFPLLRNTIDIVNGRFPDAKLVCPDDETIKKQIYNAPAYINATNQLYKIQFDNCLDQILFHSKEKSIRTMLCVKKEERVQYSEKLEIYRNLAAVHKTQLILLQEKFRYLLHQIRICEVRIHK